MFAFCGSFDKDFLPLDVGVLLLLVEADEVDAGVGGKNTSPPEKTNSPRASQALPQISINGNLYCAFSPKTT